jgi:hypothetical protein
MKAIILRVWWSHAEQVPSMEGLSMARWQELWDLIHPCTRTFVGLPFVLILCLNRLCWRVIWVPGSSHDQVHCKFLATPSALTMMISHYLIKLQFIYLFLSSSHHAMIPCLHKDIQHDERFSFLQEDVAAKSSWNDEAFSFY